MRGVTLFMVEKTLEIYEHEVAVEARSYVGRGDVVRQLQAGPKRVTTQTADIYLRCQLTVNGLHFLRLLQLLRVLAMIFIRVRFLFLLTIGLTNESELRGDG